MKRDRCSMTTHSLMMIAGESGLGAWSPRPATCRNHAVGMKSAVWSGRALVDDGGGLGTPRGGLVSCLAAAAAIAFLAGPLRWVAAYCWCYRRGCRGSCACRHRCPACSVGG